MSIDDFGSILKELRTKAGLSQDYIAKKLAISRQSISKWELGISLPDITYLVPLTKILKCGLEDLLNLKRIFKSIRHTTYLLTPKNQIIAWIKDFSLGIQSFG